MIVVTKRTKITRILRVPVYAANDFALYPIQRNSSAASSSPADKLEAEPQETYLLGLIKSHLYSAPFYFTYDTKYNLTMRLQQQQEERRDDEKEKPLWESVGLGSLRLSAARQLTSMNESEPGRRQVLLEQALAQENDQRDDDRH